MIIEDSGIDHAPFHRTMEQMEACIESIREAPADGGKVRMIVRRPGIGRREVLDTAELTVEAGVVGDTWAIRPNRRTEDGGPHPEMQLNVIGARPLEAVAGAKGRWAFAGDQLVLDMDLTEANLPAGTVLEMGSARIEITAEPHSGCAKFSRRYGAEARRFVNSDVGQELRLRGLNAKVVQAGTIKVGDVVTKVTGDGSGGATAPVDVATADGDAVAAEPAADVATGDTAAESVDAVEPASTEGESAPQ